MTSLLDIGPLTEEVAVNGKNITVYGVTPEGFFFLLHKFPVLQDMFSAGGKEVSMDALREVGAECLAYALAVSTTSRAYMAQKAWMDIVEATANVALNVNANAQRMLFQATLRLTFPEGVGPFMAGVDALTESINQVSGQTVPVTTSSKPSRSGFVTDSLGMRLGRTAPRASSRH